MNLRTRFDLWYVQTTRKLGRDPGRFLVWMAGYKAAKRDCAKSVKPARAALANKDQT